MALLYPDRRLRGLRRALVAAGALLYLLPAHTANEKGETGEWSFNGFNTEIDPNARTLSTERLILRQGSTLLRANNAAATGVIDGYNIRNSTWTLTGGVHLESDGAVLDAQLATVVLVDGRMKSVQVQAAPAQLPQQKSPVHLEFNGAVLDAQMTVVTFIDGRMKTVEARGAPAQFSHKFKKSALYGRAEKIEYDAGTTVMSASGNTSYTYGNSEGESQALTYNLDNGKLHIPTVLNGTYRPEEKVPAPRTPDRASAK